MPHSVSLNSVISMPADTEELDCEISSWKNRLITRGQFILDVLSVQALLEEFSEKRWVLFNQEAYPFAVAMFALARSGKSIVVPSNIAAGTLESLKDVSDASIGDIPNATVLLEPLLEKNPSNKKPVSIPQLDLKTTEIVVFTSGSSGEPKPIYKTLAQFEYEIQSLESCFGEQMKVDFQEVAHIATVSHQHIYGLIFRVLWPLAAGRFFYSPQILDVAYLLRMIGEGKRPVVWIASPAHLKRLVHDLPWESVDKYLSTVFSSGGPLSLAGSQFVKNQLGKAPYEVYGSSETGGVAFRQYCIAAEWNVLPGVDIRASKRGALEVRSPHINSTDWYETDDAIEMLGEEQFLLKGRLDRIVKLEGKRLSLVDMETQLCGTDYITECYCFVLEKTDGGEELLRDTLVSVCQLSTKGEVQLSVLGKLEFVKQLKRDLSDYFEFSLLPKRWRFVDNMPSNTQAKIDKPAINRLFSEL